MSRLLLLACSERKRLDPGQMPATERYDGPAYRVLRRYMQSQPRDVPDVYVLSAEYGLIRGDTLIPMYDRRMTPQRAYELRESTTAELQQLDLSSRYQRVFMSAGAAYREILSSPILDILPQERLVSSVGSQGVQLTRLKSWLYQDEVSSSTIETRALSDTIPVRFKLRGRDYEIAPATVITVARNASKNGILKGLKTTAWHVLVDDCRIPSKWLVSQLTGIPVSDFHSMEARRVLRLLGFLVHS